MTADEIFTTTCLNRSDSETVAAALVGASTFIVSMFWAMIKAGCFSAEEMAERLSALRSLEKQA